MAQADSYLHYIPQTSTVSVGDLAIHPEVPIAIELIAGSTQFKAYSPDIFSEEGALFFIRRHPPEVALSDTGKALCFAGLRSMQIAISCLPADSKISVLAHKEIPATIIHKISTLDPYITYLSQALSDRTWDVDLLKKWQQIEKTDLKSLTPNLLTKKQLSELLAIPLQRLSTSRKFRKIPLTEPAPASKSLFPISAKEFPNKLLKELQKIRVLKKAEGKTADVTFIDIYIRDILDKYSRD